MAVISLFDYIEKAKVVHQDEYDYSLLKSFKTTHEYGEIICQKHGIFKVKLCSHLLGYKCNKCSYETRKRARHVNFEEFCSRAKTKFGDTYTYIENSYSKLSASVAYICPIHGEVSQVAGTHLTGKGCSKCFPQTTRSNTKEFIEKAQKIHNNFYTYELSNYIKNSIKVQITCPYHGVFEQIPNTHLLGGGCLDCAKTEINGFSRGQFETASKGRPCWLYLIRLKSSKETFYKVGISSKNVLKRLKKFEQVKYSFEILTLKEDSATNIWNLEKEILKGFVKYRYTPQKTFGGSTECFNIDLPIDEILTLINNK